MSEEVLGPGPRTRVRRLPKKATYRNDVIYDILDRASMCHVAAVVDGRAVALPTLHARDGDVLYLHGSQSNAVLRAIVDDGQACVTATIYDGLRLARSGFESSIAYRSVVVFGRADSVTDHEEKSRILSTFVDAILPGRSTEVRPMTEAEVRLTALVRVSIEEASAKVSEGPTEDSDTDADLEIWSGTVPARLVFETPIASRDGAMAGDRIGIPLSVQVLLSRQ